MTADQSVTVKVECTEVRDMARGTLPASLAMKLTPHSVSNTSTGAEVSTVSAHRRASAAGPWTSMSSKVADWALRLAMHSLSAAS